MYMEKISNKLLVIIYSETTYKLRNNIWLLPYLRNNIWFLL